MLPFPLVNTPFPYTALTSAHTINMGNGTQCQFIHTFTEGITEERHNAEKMLQNYCMEKQVQYLLNKLC